MAIKITAVNKFMLLNKKSTYQFYRTRSVLIAESIPFWNKHKLPIEYL